MLEWLNKNYSLLNAEEYQIKLKKLDTDICLSFDDGLKCQFDIAFPVLKELGIKIFLFIVVPFQIIQITWKFSDILELLIINKLMNFIIF